MRLLVLSGLRLGVCLIIFVCGNTDANIKVPLLTRDSTPLAQQVRNVIPMSQGLGFIYRKITSWGFEPWFYTVVQRKKEMSLSHGVWEQSEMLSFKLIMSVQTARWDHTSAKETF